MITATVGHQLARSILDRLGYTLQDLGLDYGDVVIPSGDISHQLYYGSQHSSCNLMGYVWIENDIYYTDLGGNRSSAEEAALDLLDAKIVENCRLKIEMERLLAVDYN